MAKIIELNPEQEKVASKIRKNKELLQSDYGVIRIGVFGKIPKNEMIDTADLNILVELNNTRLDLWRKLKAFLETLFKKPVNLITKGSGRAAHLDITNKKIRNLVSFV